MSKIAIKVEHLSKKYTLSHQKQERYVALRDVITDKIKYLGHQILKPVSQNKHNYDKEEFWPLKDICFEIEQGDSVGIIGHNGAGKSTLLKILSRITEPTNGTIKIRGRVASLLEVGTGFHPELTGRENIYLNGAILGMSKAEIKSKFDEIVNFAGVEKFLDTPVKRYSSGMYVRLAFAVAAHLEPEILVVDEVLAVGDAAFQKKCLGKMQDVANQGRTVLFVSHNMQAISALTQHCLVLSQGRCIYHGLTERGITTYLQEGANISSIYEDSPSLSEPKITRVELRTSEPGNTQAHGESMDILFEISAPVPIDGAALSFQVYNSMKHPVLHLLTQDSELPMCRQPGLFHLVCRIPKVRMYIGHYSLKVHFAERVGGKKLQTLEDICPFEVAVYGQTRDYYWYPGHATYVEDYEWQVSQMNHESLMTA